METVENLNDIRQLVVFDLAGEEYAIDIQTVQEIIRYQNITKVPKTQAFVEGVINLRGRVIPVIDLRKRFNLELKAESTETRIVVVEVSGIVIGMIVDAVSQVLRMPESSIEPPSPIVANIDSDFILGVGKLEEQLIIMLDVEKVLSGSEKDHLTMVSANETPKEIEANS